MLVIDYSIGSALVLRFIAHAPGFESFGAEIAWETGLRGGSVYKVLDLFTRRGVVEVTRVVPARHGTPRRYVQLTEVGRELAAEWSVMRRVTLAAERLRETAAALSLPRGNSLSRVAATLDKDDLTWVTFDVDKLVEAVLGRSDGRRAGCDGVVSVQQAGSRP